MHVWYEFMYCIDVDIVGFDIDFFILTLDVSFFDLPKVFTLLVRYCLNNYFMPYCISSISKTKFKLT